MMMMMMMTMTMMIKLIFNEEAYIIKGPQIR